MACRLNSIDNCEYCGLCVYGCPYDIDYCSSQTLRQLLEHDNFTYIPDTVVKRVNEKSGFVEVIAESYTNRSSIVYNCSRVYLACGFLNTAKIILESMEAYDQPLTVKDCLYFLIPLLRYKGAKNIMNTELHTLPHIFLEVLDKSLSEQFIHMQVYGYNELYLTAIGQKLGGLYKLASPFMGFILDRLFTIQGFLHSDISPNISIRLISKDQPYLVCESETNHIGKTVVKGLVKKLFKNRKYLKAIPISKALQISKPGRSFHTGGTFPMRNSPVSFESDIYGRPYGLNRIHLVDSSVFPSIPATTITLTLMANAYRIALESINLE